MVDVLLANDDLSVLGGPETVNVEVDFGQTGDRGSLIFVGNGKPDLVDIGQDIKVFDLYINLLKNDPDPNQYLMMYQYQLPLGSTEGQWQPLVKLIPNTYVTNKNIDFTTQSYCLIPISSIVDPGYTGNITASNFSVQATFSTSTTYPIANSIKTEIVTESGIQNLKITFYAKEFDGTSWVNILGSRTANLHISVV